LGSGFGCGFSFRVLSHVTRSLH